MFITYQKHSKLMWKNKEALALTQSDTNSSWDTETWTCSSSDFLWDQVFSCWNLCIHGQKRRYYKCWVAEEEHSSLDTCNLSLCPQEWTDGPHICCLIVFRQVDKVKLLAIKRTHTCLCFWLFYGRFYLSIYGKGWKYFPCFEKCLLKALLYFVKSLMKYWPVFISSGTMSPLLLSFYSAKLYS